MNSTPSHIYWSDVTNGWGNGISPGILCPPLDGKQSTWNWPPEVPAHSDWSIWASFLRDSPRTLSGYLILPLGPWIHHTHQLDFIPFCSSSQSAFVQGHGPLWHQFTAVSHHAYWVTKSFPFQCATVIPPVTDHLARVERATTQALILSGSTPLSPTHLTPSHVWPL